MPDLQPNTMLQIKVKKTKQTNMYLHDVFMKHYQTFPLFIIY